MTESRSLTGAIEGTTDWLTAQGFKWGFLSNPLAKGSVGQGVIVQNPDGNVKLFWIGETITVENGWVQ